jgi:dolichyl-diphosphooligosaccharide--protein glycosyltransferase
VGLVYAASQYYTDSVKLAKEVSEPHILLMATNNAGEEIIVRDIVDAYHWLRDNTPPDSRVLAWWDYGYHINGIANRTSIADGNTWNHEHIALLGRALISPERHAHRIIRHIADYVLVWTTRWGGMPGDDLAKCPHMARIAGSVFFDIPYREYYMMDMDTPSPRLATSLLFQLHGHQYHPSARPLKYFEEAYTTKYSMVRIFKVKNVSEESKTYIAQHHTYPPALRPVLDNSNRFERTREKDFLNL